MIDLAEYLQVEADKDRSLRKTAARLHISKTTLEKLIKRKLKTKPHVQTLENIAESTGLTLSAVAEMAGAMMADTDPFARLGRDLELRPWIKKRLPELLSLSEREFNYWMDWVAWRRRQGPPPDQSPDQPSE